MLSRAILAATDVSNAAHTVHAVTSATAYCGPTSHPAAVTRVPSSCLIRLACLFLHPPVIAPTTPRCLIPPPPPTPHLPPPLRLAILVSPLIPTHCLTSREPHTPRVRPHIHAVYLLRAPARWTNRHQVVADKVPLASFARSPRTHKIRRTVLSGYTAGTLQGCG